MLSPRGSLQSRVDRLLSGLDTFQSNTADKMGDRGWMSTPSQSSLLTLGSRSPRAASARYSDSTGAKSVSWAVDTLPTAQLDNNEELFSSKSGYSPMKELLQREVAQLVSSQNGQISRYMLDDMVHHADQLWQDREATPQHLDATRERCKHSDSETLHQSTVGQPLVSEVT